MIWMAMQPNISGEDLVEMLGYLPGMFSESDPRSAQEQLNDRYGHGGGWQPFNGFTLLPNKELKYPGDPPIKPLAITVLHNDVLIFYEHEWLLVLRPDNTWEVARVD